MGEGERREGGGEGRNRREKRGRERERLREIIELLMPMLMVSPFSLVKIYLSCRLQIKYFFKGTFLFALV